MVSARNRIQNKWKVNYNSTTTFCCSIRSNILTFYFCFFIFAILSVSTLGVFKFFPMGLRSGIMYQTFFQSVNVNFLGMGSLLALRFLISRFLKTHSD